MKLLAFIAVCVLSSFALAQPNTLTDQEKSDGWSLLFDGKTLDGWTTVGDIKAWTVAQDNDGPVITMANPGHGEWLHTTKMYRDFELLIDFDVEKGKNSGVGLRGSSVGDPAFTGMEIQVFGNQGEKPTITSCGSVYDAIAPTAMPLKDGGQWNTFRIKLVGDTINIWLNGEQIHKDQKLDTRGYVHKPEDKSPLNSRCKTGFIALQDHGDKVRFRNIKIKDLSADKDPGGFEPIFDGKSTKGWTTNVPGKQPTGKWKVEDGVLIGNDVGLVTDQSWTAAEFRAFVRPKSGGIAIFGLMGADQPSQIVSTSDARWSDLRVHVDKTGAHAWLNGEPMKLITPPKPGPARFYIWAGLEGAEFKDIQAKKLAD